MHTSARPAVPRRPHRSPPRAPLTLLIPLLAVDLAAQEGAPPPLFATNEALEMTLATDLEVLEDDRRDDSPWRPASVTVPGPDGAPVTRAAAVRTRGNFRRETCAMPPIRLRLEQAESVGTPFEGQASSLKIVSSCRPGRDRYEQLVLGEYLAYRAYALLTDRALHVRLARITWGDESGDHEPETRFAFFIEDEDALAERIGGTIYELPAGKNLPVGALEAASALRTAIFQYMIGNADWSDVASHNVEIVALGYGAVLVPYDFDFSGLLNAPYANPDPDLGIRSVTERVYRGWCWSPTVTASVLQGFRDAEPDILALFDGFPHLDDRTRTRMLRYLGRFFESIENDDRAERRFLRDCRNPRG